MKKIILVLTIGLLFLSCSSDSDSSTSSGLYKWQCKIDGVLYEWAGNHLTNQGAVLGAGGQSTYSAASIALQKLNSTTSIDNSITVSASFPTVTTGNFVFNSSNFSVNQVFNIAIFVDTQNTELYTTQFGGTMNVNIASLSNDSFTNNPSNPGKVIGTFSGTISSGDGNTVTVTDGSFEAVRAQ